MLQSLTDFSTVSCVRVRGSNQVATCPSPSESYVNVCLSLGGPYCTLDFAELKNGSWIAVESGDS
jgi:hypothetical protein